MGCFQGSNCLIYIRFITLGLIITAINHSSTAQLNSNTFDTLDSLFKEKEYAEYLTKIRKIEENIKKDNYTLCHLEDMSHYVERQIKSNDPNIIFEMRKTYSFHGFMFTKKLGDYHKALNYYLIAHSLVEDKLYLDSYSWYIEHNLINICSRLGDYEKGEYFSILTENSLICYEQWENLSRYYTDEAKRLISNNKIHESKIIYLKGLKLAMKNNLNIGILSNTNGLVDIYLRLNNLDSANFYLSISEKRLNLIRSEEKYLEYKSDFEDKKSQYYELINDDTNCLNWTKKSIESLKIFHNDNPNIRELAKAYRRYGSIYLKYNQLDSADKYFNLGLKCLIPNLEHYSKPIDLKLLYQENAFIELFDLKTNILQIRYERSNTINYIEEALIYNEHILWLNNITTQNILGDETKLLNIKDIKSHVGIGLELLYILCSNKKTNSADSILRLYFNYSKAQLINTKLQNKKIIDQIDIKTKSKIDALLERINSLQFNSENTNESNLQLIRTKIELANIIKQAEQTTLNKIYPKNYIEYSVQQEYIYRLAQLNNKVYFDRIGETYEFDNLFKAFNNALASKDQNTPIYKQISDFLLQGIDSSLPFEFTVIPDANISFIPFDCLKDPFNKNLIESHLISYSHTYGNSISKDHSNSKEIFTLAPQYPPSLNLPSIDRGSFYELKHSLEECQQLQNYYPDAKSLSRHITKNNLLDTLTNASIFHFAGHGKVSNDSSYLLLANNQELLRYEDISNYYNNMDLVVLSACETGLGIWNPGDGSKSLAKAFIESGTGAVVYSLWNMNDISTQKIMSHFYQFLSMGQAKDEALRNAKLSYINESSGDVKQNFYWAGFVATGDMAPILQTNPIFNFLKKNWVVGVTILILLIINIIYQLYKTKN
ncbi:MAG: CHAT domain-containing protein [Saprospiraceae bacterium]|nr:CHAT domain-containing protein [Saprospiraceae bacterium]